MAPIIKEIHVEESELIAEVKNLPLGEDLQPIRIINGDATHLLTLESGDHNELDSLDKANNYEQKSENNCKELDNKLEKKEEEDKVQSIEECKINGNQELENIKCNQCEDGFKIPIENGTCNTDLGMEEKSNCISSNQINCNGLTMDRRKNNATNYSKSPDSGESEDNVVEINKENLETCKSSTEKLLSLLKNVNLNMKPEDLTCLSIVGHKLEKLEFDFSSFVNISIVDLTDNLLTSLPKSFSTFKKCVQLNLSRNKFTEIPFCLHKDLYFIRDLDLSYNCIKEFSMSPVCIPYLASLNISHNELTLPPWWLLHDILSCLTSLDLSFNPCFKNKLPQPFLDTRKGHNHIASNVMELNLSNTCLGPSNLDFLKQFVCLKKLKMSSVCPGVKDSALSNCLDELPEELLCQMPLEELEADNCQMASLPQTVDRMTHLKVVRVSNNHFSWLPERFVHLECLKVLVASYCHLVYLPREMGLLTSLTQLWLSFNDISSLPDLSACRELKLLDLYSNSFSELPSTVPSLALQAFDISGNYFSPTTYKQPSDASSYERLKNCLRERLPSTTRRSDFIKIERNEKYSSSGSLSSSSKSWSSYKSNGSKRSKLSPSFGRQSLGSLKQEEVWDIDPNEAWDPELYENMRRWTSDDSLSRCRFVATHSYRDNYFCPYQEHSNFQQNLYFVFSGEEELGQFDDA